MSVRENLQTIQNQDYHHPRCAVMRRGEQNFWKFSSGGIEGVSLLDAYERRLTGLDDANDELFPADFVKVSIIIAIRGYAKYRRVKNVQRTRGGTSLPTIRSRVVECVAEAVLLFLRQPSTTASHNGSVVFGPGGVRLEDLYLLELYRYGKTLVPVLGYVPADIAPAIQSLRWMDEFLL